MRVFALTLSVVLAAAASSARATELWSGRPSGPCDFFQAELIGEYCARTAFVGVFGDFSSRTVTQTFLTSPPPVFAPTGPGSAPVLQTPGPPMQRNVSNTFHTGEEGATLALSPWEGVRITLQGDATQFRNTYGFSETFPKQDVTFYNPALTRNASGAGFFNVGAAVTLWDRQEGSARYILSVVGNLATMPGNALSAAQDSQQIGWASGARWSLGANGLSLDYASDSYLQRLDNPNDVRFVSDSRLLLASALAGVAAGPELLSILDLGHDPSLKIGWSSVAVGGRLIAAPFRATGAPVLRDVTVEGYGRDYIGQAELVPRYVGRASAYEIGGSARVNIPF